MKAEGRRYQLDRRLLLVPKQADRERTASVAQDAKGLAHCVFPIVKCRQEHHSAVRSRPARGTSLHVDFGSWREHGEQDSGQERSSKHYETQAPLANRADHMSRESWR